VPNSKPASPQHTYTGLRTNHSEVESGNNPPIIKQEPLTQGNATPASSLDTLTTTAGATTPPGHDRVEEKEEEGPLDLSHSGTFRSTQMSYLPEINVDDTTPAKSGRPFDISTKSTQAHSGRYQRPTSIAVKSTKVPGEDRSAFENN
jgi:hypothetical protein